MYVGYICFCVLESLYSSLSSPKGDMLNLMYTAIADQLTIMDFLPLQNPSKADVAIPWVHMWYHVTRKSRGKKDQWFRLPRCCLWMYTNPQLHMIWSWIIVCQDMSSNSSADKAMSPDALQVESTVFQIDFSVLFRSDESFPKSCAEVVPCLATAVVVASRSAIKWAFTLIPCCAVSRTNIRMNKIWY